MSKSFYTLRPTDPKAFYLDQGFGARGDGKTDDTLAINTAIRQLVETEGIGILFIPEGEYLISDTILIPQGVRLIGYGAKRPVIRLMDHAPGFDQPVQGDKGGSRYMVWFTSDLPSEPGGTFQDANAGTFYSTLENIDLYVGEGNTNTIAVRFHVAQNSYLAHCDFHIDSGRAGIFDVGNESEDIHFYGGDYGFISSQCSPGWPYVLLDSSFEGQRKAAIRCYDVGATLIRVQVKNTPTFLYVEDNNFEKLFIQDSLLENISECVISADSELCPSTQLNALNVHCKNAPVFFKSRVTDKTVCAEEKDYLVKKYSQGLAISDIGEEPHQDILFEIAPLEGAEPLPQSDLPDFPDMSEWVNIRTLGARGDGRTDDTAAFKRAVENHRVIYLPQGIYVLTDTIKLKKDTVLIGLHSYATQLYLPDRTPAFNGFGSPKALLEIPEGGNNIVNSIAVDTGGANQRVSGIVWKGSERSYLRDIKFVGGHGIMTNTSPIRRMSCYNATGTDDYDPLRDWDSQYPSLWIQGGGIFKDIWSASSYASMGMCVENTSVPGKIYCMSLEHHVRREAHFSNVHGWSIYGLQTEEVPSESFRAMALEFSDCKDLLLATTFNYRVSRLRSGAPYAIRINNCENIEFYGMHNFAQGRYSFDNLVFDVRSGKMVRAWELAHLSIKKPQPTHNPSEDGVEKLYDGFWFVDGSCTDSKGNVYFTDAEAKRVYRIDGETRTLTMLHELNVRPASVFCDTQDNLIIVAEYTAPRVKPFWDVPPRVLGRMLDYTKVFTVRDGEICELPIQKNAPKDAKWVYSGTHLNMANDFLENYMTACEEYFIAPDGITVIPVHSDLLRARFMTSAYANEDIYCVNSFHGRIYRFTMGENGVPTDPKLTVESGESCVVRRDDKLYVCDGQVSIYSLEGEKLDQITVPERPATISFGGRDGNTLFITARTGIYACKVK